MLPKDYVPRRGDTVLVPAKVLFDVDDAEQDVHVKVGYSQTTVRRGDVAEFISRNWSVGDGAEHCGDRGSVAAVDGNQVWLKMASPKEDGSVIYRTCGALTLTPCDEPEAAAAPAPEEEGRP